MPPGARMLVTTYGDEAMLHLGDRPTESFPRSAPGVISATTLTCAGTRPSPSSEVCATPERSSCWCRVQRLPWLATHPELERHLEERYTVVARERGIGTIYALAPGQGSNSRLNHIRGKEVVRGLRVRRKQWKRGSG